MKVYIASRYEDRSLMLEWASKLRHVGHEVTSRWIDGSHEIVKDAKGRGGQQRFAEEDVHDVMRAEILIGYSPRGGFRTGRGGRHVEFGIAVATGKRIILVGERENVFHWLSTVEVYTTFDDALQVISGGVPI